MTWNVFPVSVIQKLKAKSSSCLKRTSLSSNDHGLHDEPEELVEDLMEKKHQRLQSRGGQRDDAELQLVLKHVFRNLLISHSDGERGLALQGVTQSKETVQMIVLWLN